MRFHISKDRPSPESFITLLLKEITNIFILLCVSFEFLPKLIEVVFLEQLLPKRITKTTTSLSQLNLNYFSHIIISNKLWSKIKDIEWYISNNWKSIIFISILRCKNRYVLLIEVSFLFLMGNCLLEILQICNAIIY